MTRLPPAQSLVRHHVVLPPIFARVMTRVAHNLERGRWFSTPTTNP